MKIFAQCRSLFWHHNAECGYHNFFFFFLKIYFTEWYKVRVLQLLLVTVFSYEKSVVKKPTFERREIFDIFVSRILQLSVNYYLLLIIRSLLFQNFEIIKNAHSVYSSKCVWTTPNKLMVIMIISTDIGFL